MVHCDIKPQNFVFFASTGTWKLVDLVTACRRGAVTPIHLTLRCAPPVAARPAWLRPRQVASARCGARALSGGRARRGSRTRGADEAIEAEDHSTDHKVQYGAAGASSSVP